MIIKLGKGLCMWPMPGPWSIYFINFMENRPLMISLALLRANNDVGNFLHLADD